MLPDSYNRIDSVFQWPCLFNRTNVANTTGWEIPLQCNGPNAVRVWPVMYIITQICIVNAHGDRNNSHSSDYSVVSGHISFLIIRLDSFLWICRLACSQDFRSIRNGGSSGTFRKWPLIIINSPPHFVNITPHIVNGTRLLQVGSHIYLLGPYLFQAVPSYSK